MLLVKRFVIVTVTVFTIFLILNYIFPLQDKVEYTTAITDDRGELIHAYLTRDEKWRLKTELHEISPLLQKTIIAKEDQYFYFHPGINIIAVARAAMHNVFSGRRTSGASTITMQVARALEHRERNIAAKLIETFRALQLEWKYDKKEILQLYLNLVPYGGNIEGVKAASLLYFRKDPDHLSLAEITALSIIPNRPSSLVIGKNNDLIIKERNKWLRRFATNHLFTQNEIEDALQEPLNAYRVAVPKHAPHLSYRLKKQFDGHLIRSTINMNMQWKIEKLTADYIRTLRMKNIRNAAIVVIDNKTSQVVSYVGSASFTDTSDGGQVNGAAAIRQPGSTLKPLMYGLCMDAGLLTPKTVLNDVPVNYKGYAPENYDRKFNGHVTVEYALEQSLNIPSVKSLQLLGKDKFTSYLMAINFQQVAKDQGKLGLSMILGGCGANLEQLTGMFSAFANEGVFSAPVFIQDRKPEKQVKVLSPASAYMITEILSKVGRPDFPLNWQATERMPKIAWKTGTSYGRRDAWSIGYNKRFTVGVWIGNFSGQGIADLSGANTATPLLFKIFNTIDYNNGGDWFAPPKQMEWRQVCSDTGLPPGPHCANLLLDPFIPLISTTATCQHLQEIKVSADGSMSFCNSCAPASGYSKQLFKIIEPEMQQYLAQQGNTYKRVPAHNPDCEKVFKGDGPIILAPANGSEYFLDKTQPEPIELKASAGNDVSKLYWYINDQFYKTAAPGEKQYFVPADGTVKISCTDDKGRNRNVLIRVKLVNL